MDTTAPQSGATTAGTGGPKTIADDSLRGVAAIGQFIDPDLTEREVRYRLESGHIPHWKEGRLYVASKSALLADWRRKAAESTARQPQPRTPQNKSTRRGYRPHVDGTVGRRGGRQRRAGREART